MIFDAKEKRSALFNVRHMLDIFSKTQNKKDN